MSRVYNCADKDTELPFFSLIANAIIEHLLETGFQATVYMSAVGNQVVIDVSTIGNIGRITCYEYEARATVVGYHSAHAITIDTTEPDSFDELTKFLRAADRRVHRS